MNLNNRIHIIKTKKLIDDEEDSFISQIDSSKFLDSTPVIINTTKNPKNKRARTTSETDEDI